MATAIRKSNNNITKLHINDGSKRYALTNDFDEVVGEFIIRPGDVGIFQRLQDLQGEIDEVGAPLTGLNISADGEAEDGDAQTLTAIDEARARLYAVIDKLFAGKMAERLFGGCHPFMLVGDTFYFEQVLGVIGGVIESEFGSAVSGVNARMEKYIK